jgi:hypothetical protein
MAAMDWMTLAQDECGFPRPWVVNYSGGGDGDFLTGTDDESRRLDLHVFNHRQLYVVAADNRGSHGSGTIGRPGVAKNALTVGSVLDVGVESLGLTPGDISFSSSRGPTGDGRMKPNVVAPGHSVTSASASDLHGYRTEVPGTSFAAPLVTGLAATLMEHYPFELDPAMLRAHLMATAIAHDDVTGKSNDYGLGRVSGWVAHWDHPNNDGWSNFWFSGLISTAGGYHYRDLIVPPGTKRLSVVMTWDELPASAGASRAVMWDLDLWADQITGCSGPCAQYRSVSKVDNVEYIVVNNPPAGTYRLRAFPISAPLAGIPFGVAATVIRGDTKAEMTAYIEAPSNAPVGAPFPVTMHVGNHSYVASAVSVDLITQPPGVTPIDIVTTRLDGVNMRFTAALGTMTLGNLPPETSRYATWYFRPTTPGPKTFLFRAASENGGEILLTKTVQVDSVTNLVLTAMGTSPSAPLLAAGATFSVTDTVQNTGTGPSASSTTRYYLSPDATKSADDTLLSGTHSVPSLDPGASHTATVTVTIPLATSPNSYFLIACADDKSAVIESNEGDNCIVTPGAIVTVARPDLVETAVTMNPTAPVRAPGTTFSVTDTARNLGPVASAPSTTRYYLSLDPVKGAGDVLLLGSRAVPGLAAAAVQSGSVNVTIPAATPLNTYFLLACADDLARVTESDEANNCVASPTAAVTVTRPDLVEIAVSAPPATKQRGTTFTVTDTAQNIGAVGSGLSATRYYLSLDAVKNTGDTMLLGSRSVPGLAAGATHTGTVTLANDPHGDPAQHLFPPRVRRWREQRGGDGRDQQLQGLRQHGDRHAVTGAVQDGNDDDRHEPGAGKAGPGAGASSMVRGGRVICRRFRHGSRPSKRRGFQRPDQRAFEVHRREAGGPVSKIREVRLSGLAPRSQHVARVVRRELQPSFPRAVGPLATARRDRVRCAVGRPDHLGESVHNLCHESEYTRAKSCTPPSLTGVTRSRCSRAGRGSWAGTA